MKTTLSSLFLALVGLSAGQSPPMVMHRCQVVVVCHGSPQRQEIEVFQQQVARGLGYCPCSDRIGNDMRLSTKVEH